MKRVVALGALALVLAGCGGTSSPATTAKPVESPAVAPAALSTARLGCDRSVLPAGFRVDKAHSGRLSARTYSAAADVQAALEFDQLQSGARRVYLHRTSRNAGPAVDGVASCVSLRFPSAALATRFFGSYRTLRRQAGSLVAPISPAPKIAGLRGTAAYFEKQQSFRGYRVASTNVIEVAGVHGQTLDIASIAGASPAVSVAAGLLKSTVRGA